MIDILDKTFREVCETAWGTGVGNIAVDNNLLTFQPFLFLDDISALPSRDDSHHDAQDVWGFYYQCKATIRHLFSTSRSLNHERLASYRKTRCWIFAVFQRGIYPIMTELYIVKTTDLEPCFVRFEKRIQNKLNKGKKGELADPSIPLGFVRKVGKKVDIEEIKKGGRKISIKEYWMSNELMASALIEQIKQEVSNGLEKEVEICRQIIKNFHLKVSEELNPKVVERMVASVEGMSEMFAIKDKVNTPITPLSAPILSSTATPSAETSKETTVAGITSETEITSEKFTIPLFEEFIRGVYEIVPKEQDRERPFVTSGNVTKNWRVWCQKRKCVLVNRSAPITGKVYTLLGCMTDDKGHILGLKEKI
jgi:hypothetical protein